MVHYSFEVSPASTSDVCVGWTCTCIVLGNSVSIICPDIFQVDDKVTGFLVTVGSFQDGIGAEHAFKIEAALSEHDS